MTNTQAKDMLLKVARAIVDTVNESGPCGAPCSAIYMALQAHGCSYEQYEAIIGGLCDVGMLVKRNHTLYMA